MGYFMRFFVTGDSDITIDAITQALRAGDSSYRIENADIPDLCELYHGTLYLGELEISRPDEEVFAEELHEFSEIVRVVKGDAVPRVLQTLENTRLIVVFEAFWEEDNDNAALEVFDALDPLWDWLFAAHGGLLHYDLDGFYDVDDLILELSVRP